MLDKGQRQTIDANVKHYRKLGASKKQAESYRKFQEDLAKQMNDQLGPNAWDKLDRVMPI